MKVRTGFVSNSSSTSFNITGFGLVFNNTEEFLGFMFDNKFEFSDDFGTSEWGVDTLQDALRAYIEEENEDDEDAEQEDTETFLKDIYADREKYVRIFSGFSENVDRPEMILKDSFILNVFEDGGNYYVYLPRPSMNEKTLEVYANEFEVFLKEVQVLESLITKEYKIIGIDEVTEDAQW